MRACLVQLSLKVSRWREVTLIIGMDVLTALTRSSDLKGMFIHGASPLFHISWLRAALWTCAECSFTILLLYVLSDTHCEHPT